MGVRFVCAQVLRMCEGSPQRFVHEPIVKYLTDRGVKINLNSKVNSMISWDPGDMMMS
jgi:zeta-carotene desaturase